MSIVVLIGVFLFLRYTRHGRAVNCDAQDTSTASLMGIRINRMSSLLYGAGGALGVIGGILFLVDVQRDPRQHGLLGHDGGLHRGHRAVTTAASGGPR